MLSKSLKMLALHFLLCVAFVSITLGQTEDELKEALVKGMQLVEQGKLTDRLDRRGESLFQKRGSRKNDEPGGS